MGDHPAPQAPRPAAVDDSLACRRACKPCARRSDSTAVVPSTKSMYMYLGPKTVHAGPGGTQDGVGIESGIMAGLDAETYVALICELYKNQDGFVFSQDPNFQTSEYSNVINPMARAQAGEIERAPNYRKLSMNEYVAVVCHWLHRYYSLRTDLESDEMKTEHQKKWTFRRYREGMQAASDESPDWILRDEAWGPVFVTESGEIGDYGELYVDTERDCKISDVTFHALLQVNRKNFWEYCAECRPELLSYRVRKFMFLFQCALLWISQNMDKMYWRKTFQNSMISKTNNENGLTFTTAMLQSVTVFEFGRHKLSLAEAEIFPTMMTDVKIPFSKNIDAFPLSKWSPYDLFLTVKRLKGTVQDDAYFFPSPLNAMNKLDLEGKGITEKDYQYFYCMFKNTESDSSLANVTQLIDTIETHEKTATNFEKTDRLDAGPMEKYFWSLHHPRKLYDLLGVQRDIAFKDVHKAYKRAALKYHPDKGGDPEVFQLLKRADSILGDARGRIYYDKHGDDSLDDPKVAEKIPSYQPQAM